MIRHLKFNDYTPLFFFYEEYSLYNHKIKYKSFKHTL